MKKLLTAFSVLFLLGWTSMPAFAIDPDPYSIHIHFSGYGYEEGGFDWSYAGDELHLMAHVTQVDWDADEVALPYYPAQNEYTVYITGFQSNGEYASGNVPGMDIIVYNLGRVEIFEDPSFNGDWYAECPTVNDPPDRFSDGSLWLGGDFTEFRLELFRDYGFGSFEGWIELDSGSAFPFFEVTAYTFGGELVPPHNPGFPPCYEMSVDGQIWVEPIPTEETNISRIKALY